MSEQADRVRLVLAHRRIGSREDMPGSLAGWHTHLEILFDVMAGEQPQPFWRRHTRYESEYQERMGDDR